VLKNTPAFKPESVAGQKNSRYLITLLIPFAYPYDALIKKNESEKCM
jgi:hypothetical protein